MRELNCDVVVVGCGADGLTAALAALQNGAKVIVLERSTVDDRGGNTRWTEALLRMTLDGDPSPDFIRRFTDQAGYHIMPEFVQATAADCDSWPALAKALPFTDPELLTTFVDGIPKVLEWLRPHGIRTHPSMYPLPPPYRRDCRASMAEASRSLRHCAPRSKGLELRLSTRQRRLDCSRMTMNVSSESKLLIEIMQAL